MGNVAARKVTPREKARDKREKKKKGTTARRTVAFGEEASIEAERNIFRLATISLYPGTGCSTPHRENVVTPWRSIDLVVSLLAPTFAVLFVLFTISSSVGYERLAIRSSDKFGKLFPENDFSHRSVKKLFLSINA